MNSCKSFARASQDEVERICCRSAPTPLDLLTRKPALVLGVGQQTTWMAGFEIQNMGQGARVEDGAKRVDRVSSVKS